MFSFVEPERSVEEHEWLLSIEEEICQEFGIPYRVVNIAVDDLGASAAKKYDIEAWLPGQGRYRELTSCSNTTDYQARRLDIRYRTAPDGRPAHVHTLNGTAVTNSRTIIALLENGQREDGSVALPAVLGRYGAPEVLPRGQLTAIAATRAAATAEEINRIREMPPFDDLARSCDRTPGRPSEALREPPGAYLGVVTHRPAERGGFEPRR